MSIRFFNNTQYKNLPAEHLFAGVSHYITYLLNEQQKRSIESIELTDEKLTVFGEECIHLETKLQPKKVKGVIRWFDQLSGEGQIRLSSGASIWFFSCNVVGADSAYPQLVSNVSFSEGEAVEGILSNDPYLVRELGLINIQSIKQ
ncbi:MAG: hypothetical protein IM559_21100 [Pseudanabaena sp. M151S2SP2A07QC]|nr:hypothetical protein [Pseudanabaena sp. M151S2SP2A07QC]